MARYFPVVSSPVPSVTACGNRSYSASSLEIQVSSLRVCKHRQCHFRHETCMGAGFNHLLSQFAKPIFAETGMQLYC